MTQNKSSGPSKLEVPVPKNQFIGRGWAQKVRFSLQVVVHFASLGLLCTNVVDTTDRHVNAV